MFLQRYNRIIDESAIFLIHEKFIDDNAIYLYFMKNHQAIGKNFEKGVRNFALINLV